MPNPNLELLELAAERLRQLLPEIVFVGGCATGLLIDDPAAAPVRGTYDVDVIAEIASYAEYTVFSERLRALGFKEDSREGAPLCRWIHGALTLDVMPLDSSSSRIFEPLVSGCSAHGGERPASWRTGHSGHQRALLSRDQARSISRTGKTGLPREP